MSVQIWSLDPCPREQKTLEVIMMKITDKKKPINTIPSGVWEGSKPVNDKDNTNNTTDLQGNGYPDNKQDK